MIGLSPPYKAILADPPWRFGTWTPKGRNRCPDYRKRKHLPERHYPTMTLDAIKAVPVGDLAADDCCLFLWTTDAFLPAALSVGAAWGFVYKTVGFYWVKTHRPTTCSPRRPYPIGTGYWTRLNPEQCLLFTRGHPKRLSCGVEKLIVAPRREHSRKPDEVYGCIEALVAGPYCELFARHHRSGWDCWGNETTKFGSSDKSETLVTDVRPR